MLASSAKTWLQSSVFIHRADQTQHLLVESNRKADSIQRTNGIKKIRAAINLLWVQKPRIDSLFSRVNGKRPMIRYQTPACHYPTMNCYDSRFCQRTPSQLNIYLIGQTDALFRSAFPGFRFKEPLNKS